jgi:hypothetical protein
VRRAREAVVRTRDYRRAKVATTKARVLAWMRAKGWPTDARMVGRVVAHRPLCTTRGCCGNPRHSPFRKGAERLTMQERRAACA